MKTKANNFNLISQQFLDDYAKNQEPIRVNFKKMVEDIKFQDRATHSIHIYPAKLLPNIPYFFLNNHFFVKDNELVLDPFSGSGTVLLEANLAGKNSFGCDSNPLAQLITKVKTSNYDISVLKNILESLKIEIKNITMDGNEKFPDVVNIDYWFLPNIKFQLYAILKTIKTIKDDDYRDFFILCFSNCVKKVSLADSRISVPVKVKVKKETNNFHPFFDESRSKLKNLENINVFEKFTDIVNDNIRRFENKQKITSKRQTTKIVSEDARNLNLPDESVDLIISSPPYAGAQKYIRACSLNLGWTELSGKDNLRTLDKKNIGRENYSKSDYLTLKATGLVEADMLLKEIYIINPLRAHIAANYLLEMKQAISEASRVLKKDKYFILIAANNQVCNREFKTQEYLRQIAENVGLKTMCRLVDDIKSYGLMTKRNKTASVITCEWVLILKKE
ncbi:DNA methyltransferase [Flavobacterium aquiphilum]|uniref:DNA methyltransferase n=1 Tax=Flavobacterium aquiphilum TaxID=3003261 RepID=UPI0024819727|nr:DNA methyltransferase [Flavobacterium aquiphilum]